MADTVRVLVALDVPASQAADRADLIASVSARLQDEAGYLDSGDVVTPVRVAVALSDDDTDLAEVPGGLEAVYAVGIDGHEYNVERAAEYGDDDVIPAPWDGDEAPEHIRTVLLAPGRNALVLGQRVSGISTGPGYRNEWEGVYVGVSDSEGEPYHYFKDGHVNGFPQSHFGFPTAQTRLQRNGARCAIDPRVIGEREQCTERATTTVEDIPLCKRHAALL